MKKLLSFVTAMLLSLVSMTQVVDYTKKEITINYEAEVEEVILYKVVKYSTYTDYYPIDECYANGDYITINVSEGIYYALYINQHSFIHFSVNSQKNIETHDVAILDCSDCFFYKEGMTFTE